MRSDDASAARLPGSYFGWQGLRTLRTVSIVPAWGAGPGRCAQGDSVQNTVQTSHTPPRTDELGQPGSTAAPLRVCHLAKFYPPAPGGIESHVRTLARAQAELGATV